jgi:hypothetical protein
MRSSTPISLAVTVTLLALAPARATTVLAVPIDEMARTAGLVVRGVVEGQKVARTADGLNIETRTYLRVTSVLKGAPVSTVVVSQVGGTLGDVTQMVPGDARFVAGEEVVVFLEALPGTRHHVLSAMAAAKFTVLTGEKGPLAVRELGGLTFARRGADGRVRVVPDAPAGSLPLSSVLEAVARGAARK